MGVFIKKSLMMASILVSLLMALGYLYTGPDPLLGCKTPIWASMINTAEIAVTFLAIFGVNIVAICKVSTVPHSVMKRSLRHATLYILAFFLSYGVQAAYHLIQFFHPRFVDNKDCTYVTEAYY